MYGGILQMYCVGICHSYSMTLPQQVLRGLAADQIWSINACH